MIDLQTGVQRPKALEDQHHAISGFSLNTSVPKDICVHFETAKNLFLYAWFVYRFYSVAEQQALASLEFALRERCSDFVELERKKHPKKPEPGLRKLLKHAIAERIVVNENLLARDRWVQHRAKSRYRGEKFFEMRNAGIESWIEDESDVKVLPEDMEFDWLGTFCEIIPNIRNSYAHGSFHLYPASVARTFEMVLEIINQLYPE